MAFDAELVGKLGWTARNEHWLGDTVVKPKRRLRDRRIEPLILCGHGVHLGIERDTLTIRNGFTHYPQAQETYRFFRGDLTTPTRIIMLDGSGSLSFDVIGWLSDQGVSLVKLDWRGGVVAVIGGAGYSGDRTKVAWQIATRDDAMRRVEFSTAIIEDKLAASIVALETALPNSARVSKALDGLRADLSGLNSAPPADVTGLRGIEARAGAAYFSAWKDFPLNWTKTTRKPVPDLWKTFGPRSAVRVGKVVKNERATHPLNAMLNYGYAILQSHVQIAAVAEGYDPTIGIMHRGYRGSLAYVFDLMEPKRPVIDAAILEFVAEETFTADDFEIRNDGACRLVPQLAKKVAAVASAALTPSANGRN